MSSKMAEEIAERVTIPEVLQKYGFEPGRNRRIPCPLHAGKDANFAYTDHVFHCWTCGAKGNVIGLVIELFGLSFGQVLVKMNCDFSLGLAAGKPTYRQRKEEQGRRAERIRIRAEKEECRQGYLQACRLYAVLYGQLLRTPEMGSLAEYVDKLDLWLDEHIEEVKV